MDGKCEKALPQTRVKQRGKLKAHKQRENNQNPCVQSNQKWQKATRRLSKELNDEAQCHPKVGCENSNPKKRSMITPKSPTRPACPC